MPMVGFGHGSGALVLLLAGSAEVSIQGSGFNPFAAAGPQVVTALPVMAVELPHVHRKPTIGVQNHSLGTPRHRPRHSGTQAQQLADHPAPA